MSFIWTFGGHRVSLTDPRPEQIRIEDIARALSRICRWTGHTRRFFSVAQHSCYVSRQVHREHALVGLLHDASESYCSDLARPLKHVLGHNYASLERRFAGVIGERFGVNLAHLPQNVHDVDRLMQMAEASALLNVPRPELIEHFGELPETLPSIFPWSAEEAEDMFLHRFSELGGKA